MSVDYHALLWQQLSKIFRQGSMETFVLAVKKFLLYSDYALVKENPKRAERNTFELTDSCIECSTHYNPIGSKISILWDQLLNQGKGPPPDPEQQAAFEQAQHTLYKDWDTRTPSPFYQSYIDAKTAYLGKMVLMKAKYKKEYGNSWEEPYEEAIRATPEYQNYHKLDKEITPSLKAIDDWFIGSLAGVLSPMKKGMAITV